MKTPALLLTMTALFATSGAMAQPDAKCAGLVGSQGYKAYVILDQSPKADTFRQAMKKVAQPELAGLNHVYGAFSKLSASAERHPLVYVFDPDGRARQPEDPDEFVAFMNSQPVCPL